MFFECVLLENDILEPKYPNSGLTWFGYPVCIINHILEKNLVVDGIWRVPSLDFLNFGSIFDRLWCKITNCCWFAVSAASKTPSLRSGFADLPWVRRSRPPTQSSEAPLGRGERDRTSGHQPKVAKSSTRWLASTPSIAKNRLWPGSRPIVF